jgi:hypothetical protein
MKRMRQHTWLAVVPWVAMAAVQAAALTLLGAS